MPGGQVIMGIDEAGRGPVIGPLVVAGVKATKEGYEKLKLLGITDSKLLKKEKREELFSKIKKIAQDYQILIIEPKIIDDALNNPKYNLNLLEEDKMIEAILKLQNENENIDVYIDCPTPKTSTLKNYMEAKISTNKLKHLNLIPKHKADLNYIIVGAASILAKVTRDNEIEKLKKIHGDFGSGYPSDPKTKNFLKNNLNLDIYRKTWSTYKLALSEKKQTKLFDF